jgi:hypothetical protein
MSLVLHNPFNLLPPIPLNRVDTYHITCNVNGKNIFQTIISHVKLFIFHNTFPTGVYIPLFFNCILIHMHKFRPLPIHNYMTSGFNNSLTLLKQLIKMLDLLQQNIQNNMSRKPSPNTVTSTLSVLRKLTNVYFVILTSRKTCPLQPRNE